MDLISISYIMKYYEWLFITSGKDEWY